MRHIGTLPDEQTARRFTDYLFTVGIQASAEENGPAWAVWVYDEDLVAKAREELAAYSTNPQAPQYQQADRAAADLREQSVKESLAARRRVVNVREEWRKPVTSRCPVTIGLLMLCLLVAAGSDFGKKQEPLLNQLSIASYKIERNTITWEGLADVRHGQVWRLVTPMFIHFGIMHVAFNAMMFYQFGMLIEGRRGSLRFFLFVLLTATLSNLGQYWWSQSPGFGGMSGVNYGLFGYLWMKSRHDPNAGFYLPPSTVVIMVGWFFLCMTGQVGPIANAAHGVGLMIGILAGYARPLWRKYVHG